MTRGLKTPMRQLRPPVCFCVFRLITAIIRSHAASTSAAVCRQSRASEHNLSLQDRLEPEHRHIAAPITAQSRHIVTI